MNKQAKTSTSDNCQLPNKDLACISNMIPIPMLSIREINKYSKQRKYFTDHKSSTLKFIRNMFNTEYISKEKPLINYQRIKFFNSSVLKRKSDFFRLLEFFPTLEKIVLDKFDRLGDIFPRIRHFHNIKELELSLVTIWLNLEIVLKIKKIQSLESISFIQFNSYENAVLTSANLFFILFHLKDLKKLRILKGSFNSANTDKLSQKHLNSILETIKIPKKYIEIQLGDFYLIVSPKRFSMIFPEENSKFYTWVCEISEFILTNYYELEKIEISLFKYSSTTLQKISEMKNKSFIKSFSFILSSSDVSDEFKHFSKAFEAFSNLKEINIKTNCNNFRSKNFYIDLLRLPSQLELFELLTEEFDFKISKLPFKEYKAFQGSNLEETTINTVRNQSKYDYRVTFTHKKQENIDLNYITEYLVKQTKMKGIIELNFEVKWINSYLNNLKSLIQTTNEESLIKLGIKIEATNLSSLYIDEILSLEKFTQSDFELNIIEPRRVIILKNLSLEVDLDTNYCDIYWNFWGHPIPETNFWNFINRLIYTDALLTKIEHFTIMNGNIESFYQDMLNFKNLKSLKVSLKTYSEDIFNSILCDSIVYFKNLERLELINNDIYVDNNIFKEFLLSIISTKINKVCLEFRNCHFNLDLETNFQIHLKKGYIPHPLLEKCPLVALAYHFKSNKVPNFSCSLNENGISLVLGSKNEDKIAFDSDLITRKRKRERRLFESFLFLSQRFNFEEIKMRNLKYIKVDEIKYLLLLANFKYFNLDLSRTKYLPEPKDLQEILEIMQYRKIKFSLAVIPHLFVFCLRQDSFNLNERNGPFYELVPQENESDNLKGSEFYIFSYYCSNEKDLASFELVTKSIDISHNFHIMFNIVNQNDLSEAYRVYNLVREYCILLSKKKFSKIPQFKICTIQNSNETIDNLILFEDEITVLRSKKLMTESDNILRIIENYKTVDFVGINFKIAAKINLKKLERISMKLLKPITEVNLCNFLKEVLTSANIQYARISSDCVLSPTETPRNFFEFAQSIDYTNRTIQFMLGSALLPYFVLHNGQIVLFPTKDSGYEPHYIDSPLTCGDVIPLQHIITENPCDPRNKQIFSSWAYHTYVNEEEPPEMRNRNSEFENDEEEEEEEEYEEEEERKNGNFQESYKAPNSSFGVFNYNNFDEGKGNFQFNMFPGPKNYFGGL